MVLHLHEIIYIIIFFCTAALFALAWPRRRTPGGIFFVLHILALAVWDLGLFFEAVSSLESTKILFSQISYFGVVSVAPLLFLFILAYTRQEKVRPIHVISLMIVPFLVVIFAWTNQWHHLLWPGFYWGSSKFDILVYEHGFIFYVNVIYIYTLIMFGIVILIRAISRTIPPFRSQLIVVLAAVLFPMISGCLYIFNLNPVPGMDISIFGFLMTNLILAFGFVHYQLLDLVPVARGVLIENLQDGMVVVDWLNRIVEINQNAIDLMNLPQTGLLGIQINDVFPFPLDLPELNSKNSPMEYAIGHSHKRYIDLRVSSLNSRSDNPPGYLIVLRDITFQKEAEFKLKNANQNLQTQLDKINGLQSQLKDQALHDSLTGLFNFRAMDEILEKLLDQCKSLDQLFSIVILDVDHFKRVNDVYGHQAGNFLLQEYGKVISRSVRKNDFACRFGGDEILLAFQEMGLKAATSKAEELRENLKKIVIEQNLSMVSTTVSIGVSTYPLHGINIRELISAADQALYEAKEQGRDQVVQAHISPSINSPASDLE